jgi:predicted deacylase
MDSTGAHSYPEATVPGQHLIAAFDLEKTGPTLIVVGGLHGNEPAGVLALERVAKCLRPIESKLKGRVFLIAGNTRALPKGVRYIDVDLNRVWTAANLGMDASDDLLRSSEENDLIELYELIDSILIGARDEVYVVDLHSTSAGGVPFATVGDTMRNRAFATKFPVTILLGIEEQLEGTMLEHLNDLGAVTIGFEGGSHLSTDTIDTHEALVWAAIYNSGILGSDDVPKLTEYLARLSSAGDGPGFVEVRYREAIRGEDEFVMDTGYNNFDPVKKGQKLARNRHGEILSTESGMVLMPLYQKLGEDGFFVGRRVAPFWLGLSRLLRRAGVQNIIHWLPGVTRTPEQPERLEVDTRIARLFPLQVFHLLGYRKRRWADNKLIVRRRRHDSISPFKKEV